MMFVSRGDLLYLLRIFHIGTANQMVFIDEYMTNRYPSIVYPKHRTVEVIEAIYATDDEDERYKILERHLNG